MNKLKLLFTSTASAFAFAGVVCCQYAGQELLAKQVSLAEKTVATAKCFANERESRNLSYEVASCNRLLDKQRLVPPNSDLFHIVSSHCRDLEQRESDLESQQAQLRTNEEVKNTIAKYAHLKTDSQYLLISGMAFGLLFNFGWIESYRAWKEN